MPASSALAQYALELINRMRLDPAGELRRLLTSLSPLKAAEPGVDAALAYFGVSGATLAAQWATLVPVAPLAWSDDLATAATGHAQKLVADDAQSHQQPGELPLGGRIRATGYDLYAAAENVYSYALTVPYAHGAFAIDWGSGGIQDPPGHRQAMMSSLYREVGIAVVPVTGTGKTIGPLVEVQDFAVPMDPLPPVLLGVAFRDAAGTGWYLPGEELAGLAVQVDATGTTTAAAGGWQLATTAGLHHVTFSGAGLSAPLSVTLSVGTANVKLDVTGPAAVDASTSLVLGQGVRQARLIGTAVGTLTGNDLGDTLIANDAGTTLLGGAGNDTLKGGAGNDTMDGGGGFNRASYAGMRASYAVSIASGVVTVRDVRTGAPDGTDTLRRVQAIDFADATVVTGQFAVQDFDASGTSDVLFAGPGGRIASWSVAGGVATGNTVLGPAGSGWTLLGSADFNADGTADLLFRHSSGLLAQWRMQAGRAVAATVLGTMAAGTSFVGTGDLNGDGTADLLFRNAAGVITAWQVTNGVATATRTVGTTSAAWTLATIGDLNGDGTADLLFVGADGTVADWLVKGGTATSAGVLGKTSAYWSVVGLADVDGDGQKDILFRSQGGDIAAWMVRGGAVTGSRTIGHTTAAWQIAALGDYNGDGTADILFRSTDGHLAAWLLHGGAVARVTGLGTTDSAWQVLA